MESFSEVQKQGNANPVDDRTRILRLRTSARRTDGTTSVRRARRANADILTTPTDDVLKSDDVANPGYSNSKAFANEIASRLTPSTRGGQKRGEGEKPWTK